MGCTRAGMAPPCPLPLPLPLPEASPCVLPGVLACGLAALLVTGCGLLGPRVSEEGQARCRQELAAITNPLARPLARQRCLASIEARLRDEARQRQQALQAATARCRRQAPQLTATLAQLRAAQAALSVLHAARYQGTPPPQPLNAGTESRFRREDQELDQERYEEAYRQWQEEESRRAASWQHEQDSQKRLEQARLNQAAGRLRQLQPALFRGSGNLEVDAAAVRRYSRCEATELTRTLPPRTGASPNN